MEKIMEIYKSLFKIKKEEIYLLLITFTCVFLRSSFFEKISPFYFLFFLLEIYLTVSVYSGIKKSLYNDNFKFSDIFKDGLYFFPSILLYQFIVGLCFSIIYLIISSLIDSIKSFSFFSFFLFFLIIVWGAIGLYFLFLTIYTPFIVISEEEILFDAILKSFKFMKKNIENLIVFFFPFSVLWFVFFTNFQKYVNIFFLRFFLLFLISFLEILTVKLAFLIYKERGENERNF
ncbi:MAG: hypothetical protein ACP5OB_04905 [Candidatus Ratteibacteria bacterium]